MQEGEAAWQALGSLRYWPTETKVNRLLFRQSIYVAEDIAGGEVFTTENLQTMLPEDRAAPSRLHSPLGTRGMEDNNSGMLLTIDFILL